MRLGLLSDTHLPGAIDSLGDLGPEPAQFFSTVDLILHAGDVTAPSVLDWLEQFAPVICATGNNDGLDDPRTKEVQMLEIEGVEGPQDLAIVGNERQVESQLRSLANAGATDLLASIFPVDEGPESIPRTRALLKGLIGVL